MSLLSDPVKENKIKILDLESYNDTFGPNKRRKRVKLNMSNFEEMAEDIGQKDGKYVVTADQDLTKYNYVAEKKIYRDKRMEAGQSKRIWDELYKVLDSSDVIC